MQTVDIDKLLTSPQLVLDLGCGRGRHTHAACLAANASVVALDLEFDELQGAREGLASIGLAGAGPCLWLCGDGTRLPLADASVDTVICAEVLEHVRDWQAVANEIERVLKPGGRLAVSVPRLWPEWLCWRLSSAYHSNVGGHLRIFHSRELRETFRALGFDFSTRHWAHALHTPYWWLRCLFWKYGEQFPPVRLYHRLLVWDLVRKPRLTRAIETMLNPLLGKSVVLYFVKSQSAAIPSVRPQGNGTC